MTWILSFLPFAGVLEKIVKLITDTLGAILPKIAEIIGDLLKRLWGGYVHILEKPFATFGVVLLCLATMLYTKVDKNGFWSCDDSVSHAISNLRKDYVFIKRKDAEKKKLKDAFINN